MESCGKSNASPFCLKIYLQRACSHYFTEDLTRELLLNRIFKKYTFPMKAKWVHSWNMELKDFFGQLLI